MMKVKYSIVFILAMLLVGCSSNKEYTYKLIFTDGTEEMLITKGELKLDATKGCTVATGCGCSVEEKDMRCGVRQLVLVSQRELGGKSTSNKSYIPDDDF